MRKLLIGLTSQLGWNQSGNYFQPCYTAVGVYIVIKTILFTVSYIIRIQLDGQVCNPLALFKNNYSRSIQEVICSIVGPICNLKFLKTVNNCYHYKF